MAAVADCSGDLGKNQPPIIVKGGVQIKKLFNKCGITCSMAASNGKKALTINQELAKLSSIPKDDYDCATFWREYSNAMPNLAILARKYLSISATSVPSESAFSVSNYILRKNRLALTSRNVKYTMFLKDKLI
jgi:hAT family protein